MNKDKLINGLNAIQNGRDAGKYHDELELAIAVIMNATDDAIADAWLEIREDAADEIVESADKTNPA
jgi:hypothetical protein